MKTDPVPEDIQAQKEAFIRNPSPLLQAIIEQGEMAIDTVRCVTCDEYFTTMQLAAEHAGVSKSSVERSIRLNIAVRAERRLENPAHLFERIGDDRN